MASGILLIFRKPLLPLQCLNYHTWACKCLVLEALSLNRLEIAKSARYSQSMSNGACLMRLIILLGLTLLLQPLAYAQDANALSCVSCSSRNNNCPQDNLSHNVVLNDLSMNRRIDDLSVSHVRDDLRFSKINVPLTHGDYSTHLSMRRYDDVLSRGAYTQELTFSKQRNDLSRGAHTAELSFGKPTAHLTRGEYSKDLSMRRVNDDLSRGKDTEPLSRCD